MYASAAFDLPSNFLNPRVPCSSMPQIDLNAWRENVQGCQIGNRNVRVQCASLRVADYGQLIRQLILRDDGFPSTK